MIKFYISIASILSILLGISEEKIDNASDYLKIDDCTIHDAYLYANSILAQRDRVLFTLTKKYEIEKKLLYLLRNNKQEYIYKRDLYRKFGGNRTKVLDNIIIKLMIDGNIERWRVGKNEANNTPIIYRYTKRNGLLKNLQV